MKAPAAARSRLAWLAGGLALAGGYAWRRLRRPYAEPPPSESDPRAEELRRRLEESRPLVEEREAFEAGETPVDRADPEAPAAQEPEARRRAVHEQARAAVDEMRGGDAA